ncbi:head GIN domain-containing protein [Pontibacter sp. G13]|uniref:head GIN domain-containing protein n=1 Tax=Pontibacter sp. G13 TaxID=3074898 RepID=UPI00288A5F4F|nr:head GIN domain-containing protein [Pontibacter sp. G13]WNJ18545.1 head GIN domain-containing protein [Pontibacter sp. G13]
MKNLVSGLMVCLLISVFGFQTLLGQDVRGTGEVISRTMDVDRFDGMAIDGVWSITLVQSSQSKVTVETDRALLPHIQILTQNGNLKVNMDVDNLEDVETFRLTIYTPNINRIELDGAAKLVSEREIQGSELAIELAGASQVELGLDYDAVSVNMGGASLVNLTGYAKQAKLDITGTGAMNAEGMDAERVKVSLSGAAFTKVSAIEFLDVSISGLGVVSYKGDPEIRKDISGLGSLNRI